MSRMTFILLFAGVTFTVSLIGQPVTGSIHGNVKDPRGAVVPGASVTAKCLGTGAQTVTETGRFGSYRLSNLVPGEYVVEFSAPGLQRISMAAGRLGATEQLRLDASLPVGELSQSITVQGSVAQSNSADAQLGRTIREMPQLPILSGAAGRSALALAGMAPGVSMSTGGRQFGDLAMNGQRFSSNNFFFEGVDANYQTINRAMQAVAAISPNAVAEFRLITGPMKAEYGRNSGAVVMVTPKSGTNNWHGAAAEILRNTKLNAVPFFFNAQPGGTTRVFSNGAPRRPQYNSNDFDANLGGPVRKNATFIFGSYLGFRRRQGVTASAVVPNESQRAAINSEGRPEARALLGLIAPATSGNTLLSAPSNSHSRDQGLIKLDHSLSSANRFSATYYIDEQSLFNPFTASPVPGFGGRYAIRQQNLVLQDTHAISPTLFHEFRAAFSRHAGNNLLPVNRTLLKDLGLSAAGANPDAEGPPYVSIAGMSSFGNANNGPQAYFVKNYQILDNVTWLHSRHAVKFGGYFKTFAMDTTFNQDSNGTITIDGSGTLSAPRSVPKVIAGLTPSLNDFANGYAIQFVQASSPRWAHRSRSVNLFAQDDWRIAGNLMVNFGLRWEYDSPYTDRRDRMATYRPGTQSAVFPDAPLGLVYPGDEGVPRGTYSGDRNNFAPRLGLAWDVLGNSKLIVRGGYGLFYEVPYQELVVAVSTPPYVIRPTSMAVDYANPWATSRVAPRQQPFPHEPPKPGGRLSFVEFAPIGLKFVDPDFRTPYGQQWMFQLQHQFHAGWLLEAGYVASNGVKLISEREHNPAVSAPGATVANTNQRRAVNLTHPQSAQYRGAVYGPFRVDGNMGHSSYHSLQIQVTRRLSGGLQTTHAYTWGHSIDNTSGRWTYSRPEIHQDRGNSDMDIRQRYVASFVWEAPFRTRHTGPLAQLVRGWSLSGLLALQTGLWATVTEPQDRCLCAVPNPRADSTGIPLSLFDPRSTQAVQGRPNSWFDGSGGGTPAATANPHFRRVGSGPSFALGAGRYGNAGRNTIPTPGLNNWDLAASKRTAIREGHTLELRAEFFNAFNHAQFGFPDTNIESPNFGRITSTASPRVVQLALRYLF